MTASMHVYSFDTHADAVFGVLNSAMSFGFPEEAYIRFLIVLNAKLMRSVELRWLLMWYGIIASAIVLSMF